LSALFRVSGVGVCLCVCEREWTRVFCDIQCDSKLRAELRARIL